MITYEGFHSDCWYSTSSCYIAVGRSTELRNDDADRMRSRGDDPTALAVDYLPADEIIRTR